MRPTHKFAVDGLANLADTIHSKLIAAQRASGSADKSQLLGELHGLVHDLQRGMSDFRQSVERETSQPQKVSEADALSALAGYLYSETGVPGGIVGHVIFEHVASQVLPELVALCKTAARDLSGTGASTTGSDAGSEREKRGKASRLIGLVLDADTPDDVLEREVVNTLMELGCPSRTTAEKIAKEIVKGRPKSSGKDRADQDGASDSGRYVQVSTSIHLLLNTNVPDDELEELVYETLVSLDFDEKDSRLAAKQVVESRTRQRQGAETSTAASGAPSSAPNDNAGSGSETNATDTVVADETDQSGSGSETSSDAVVSDESGSGQNNPPDPTGGEPTNA